MDNKYFNVFAMPMLLFHIYIKFIFKISSFHYLRRSAPSLTYAFADLKLVKRKVLPRENNAHFKDYEIGDK
jgi:hypothetical protein